MEKLTPEKEQKTREEFRKAVWLLTYPNAENHIEILEKCSFGVGRVLAALPVKHTCFARGGGLIVTTVRGDFIWKLLNDDGSEATEADQDLETIKKLLKLIK